MAPGHTNAPAVVLARTNRWLAPLVPAWLLNGRTSCSAARGEIESRVATRVFFCSCHCTARQSRLWTPFGSRASIQLMTVPPVARHDIEDIHSIEEFALANVPIVTPETTAAEILVVVSRAQFDRIDEIVVATSGIVTGVVGLDRVVLASPETAVSAIMDADPPRVRPGLPREIAAWQAVDHGEASLIVVDDHGRFRGLVPPHRMLGVLLAEHDEDLARMGGYLKETRTARMAGEERIASRFVHRLPWLLLGLLGAFVAANIVAAFETKLETNILLAFFVPGIVYLADAVGTQTETVVIRALSVGVPIGRMALREIATGILIGVVLSMLLFPAVWWRWNDVGLALTTALAVLIACTAANGIALALPWLFDRFGIDPAFGSGPVATVIQDLVSISIYFAIAMWVMA